MTISYSCALIDQNKDLWTWGYNGYGQLGNGSSSTQSLTKPNTYKWKHISMGYHHSLGLLEDGTMMGAGYGGHYSLGHGGTHYLYTFTKVNNYKWKYVVAGHTSSAGIQEDGSLWTWGSNSNNVVGSKSYTTPTRLATGKWKKVVIGYYHCLAIKEDGTLWSWGYNGYGQLGIGNTGNRSAPVLVSGEKWKDIACGGYFSMGVKEDGSVWTWGYNNYGQLGLGHYSNIYVPTRVSLSNIKAVMVSCGTNHSLFLDDKNNVYTCGYGGNYNLGNSSTGNRPTFSKPNTSIKFKSITTGYDHSFGVTIDNRIYHWGYSGHYQAVTTNGYSVVPSIINGGLTNVKTQYLHDSFNFMYGLKSFFYFGGKYHRWKETVQKADGITNTVPEMNNATSPSGVVTQSHGTGYLAFQSNTSYWYATSSSVPSTKLASGGSVSGHYIQYEYPEPISLNRITITAGAISGSNHGLRTFEFHGSNDGENFTPLYIGQHANSANTQEYSFHNSNTYQYYRLVGKTGYYSTTRYILITRLEFFETPSIAEPEHWEEVSSQVPTKEVFEELGQPTEKVVYVRSGNLEPVKAVEKKDYLNHKLYSNKIKLSTNKYLDINRIFSTYKT